MHKLLESRLVNEVKEKVPKVDLPVEDIVLITTTTLYTMAKFSVEHRAHFLTGPWHSRARFLRGAGNMVEKILTED
jgi:hypothetical protein